MEKIRAEELLRNLRDIHLTADRQVPKEQIISKQHLHTLTLGETVNEEELAEFLGTNTTFEITYLFHAGIKTVNEIVLAKGRIKVFPGEVIIKLNDGSLAVSR